MQPSVMHNVKRLLPCVAVAATAVVVDMESTVGHVEHSGPFPAVISGVRNVTVYRLTPSNYTGEGCYFLVFVQLFEKYGTSIERNTALSEKVSTFRPL
eukprot:SAG31_NODE_344_length_17385_cov_58.217575_9_plen_98_part_00